MKRGMNGGQLHAGEPPSGLEEFVPRVAVAYINSRMELARQMVENKVYVSLSLSCLFLHQACLCINGNSKLTKQHLKPNEKSMQ